uniref:Uncharacterized protein n=1 Tax=Anguilla anguilla TaxID=7936 RepID=A0A0E9VYT1_ANGAN
MTQNSIRKAIGLMWLSFCLIFNP